MGGGLAAYALAGAVSAAGGLGTIGILAPQDLRQEIAACRRLTDRPVAVNLLLPFARGAHFEAASDADAVVTFWGRPKRRTAKVWLHQCGSVEEARAARAAGADAVIAQGFEAGGHVRGTRPALELLARVRAAVPDDYPILSAGGVFDAAGVKERLDAGAAAVVCGTRFLMTHESGAHPAYKARLLEARATVLTELFGAGWPAPHRVVPNAATARWLGADSRGPGWLRAFHRMTAPAFSTDPGAGAIPAGDDAAGNPADVRPGRGDRRPSSEPGRGGSALCRGVHRAHRRPARGGRARPRAGAPMRTWIHGRRGAVMR